MHCYRGWGKDTAGKRDLLLYIFWKFILGEYSDGKARCVCVAVGSGVAY